jgi:hypothetical protein
VECSCAIECNFVRNFLSFSRFSSKVLANAGYIIVKRLHTILPNVNLTGANIFKTLDVILNAAFAIYTLYLVATLSNTCVSCSCILRNTFDHPELFVLITYRCPLFWVLAKRCSETLFDRCIRLCLDKTIRPLCLRKRFVATEMIFHTFACTDTMRWEKAYFDSLCRRLYKSYICTTS